MAGTYTNLLYHIVFSTKERRQILKGNSVEQTYNYIGGIIRNEKGCLYSIGGMPEHIHLLLHIPPIISVSDMIKNIKGSSSKWIKNERHFNSWSGWQRGYGAFSVSKSSIKKVEEYITGQKEHHRQRTFKDEFIELLKKHDIEYDERYIWD